MCNNKCPTVTRCTLLHFRGRRARDKPSAQKFTKYIGKQSPAPLLESALARSLRCDSYCDSRMWWSPYLQPEPKAGRWWAKLPPFPEVSFRWSNRIFPSNSPDFSLGKYPVQPGKIPVVRTIPHNHRAGHKVRGGVRDRLQLEKCSSSVGLQTCNPL